MHKPDNIIAIASGKGGVGKTWLAVTLSHLFARSGRRVLLFDGDIGLANVDVQMGITPRRDLSNVFSGQHRLDEVITHFTTGLDIIAGCSGSAGFLHLSAARLDDIGKQLTHLAKNYDLVIVDLGAGIEPNVRALAGLASRCIVVVTDEPTSLTDAYAFIKLCHSDQSMPEIQVVVNQAASQREGEKTFASLHRACTSFLKLSPECIGIVRKDNKVRDTIRMQKSLLTTAPHSTAATDVATISIKLLRKETALARMQG